MNPSLVIRTVVICFVLLSAVVYGQVAGDTVKGSLAEKGKAGSGKVMKNRFLQWPDHYFSIQCGLQDKLGNLWFGSSADGVYHYDGKFFVNFTRKDGLCNNDVLCMLEDKAGSIWLGTRGGLCRYQHAADKSERMKFSSVQIPGNGNRMAANFVWSIMQDKAGRIWLGTNEGVFLSETAGAVPEFKPFLENDSIVNKEQLQLKVVQKIVEDKLGNIWFASGDAKGEGICCYNGHSIISYKPDSVTSFRSVVERKNGDLLFLSSRSVIYQYDGKSFTDFTKKAGLKGGTINAMLEDKEGNIWMGQDHENDMEKKGQGGVWLYDGKSLKLFTAKDGMRPDAVFSILEDSAGNIWLGTRNTGLCLYDGKTFTDYTGQ